MCYCVSACKANCVNYYSVGYNFAKNSSNHNSSNKMSSNNKNSSNMSGLNNSSSTSNKYGTGQLISEWLFDVLNFPKTNTKTSWISTQEFKKWLNLKDKGTVWYVK